MKTVFKGKKISGILSMLPSKESSFEDTIEEDSLSRVRRLKRVMGFDKRRRADKDACVSDYFKYGIRCILDHKLITKEEIGAIIVVTLCQDFPMPTVSCILHGEFEFDQDVICVDIPQGCSGYLVGLVEAFSVLNHLGNKKVLLCTGDILNRLSDNEKKSTEPSFGGDALTISVIENDDSFGKAYFNYYTDGSRSDYLIMPAGAFAHPVYSMKDTYVKMDGIGEGYGLGIWMDGSAVFNFIVTEVPPMIEEILEYSNSTKEDIDYWLFHQPNRYILQKVAQRLNVSSQKMPMNVVEKYGNSNSSTIPVVICDNVAQIMKKERKKCCLSGFGSGVTWSSAVLELGEMDFCELIDVDLQEKRYEN